jgi:F-type H+-transporting ATPase subunit delta
VSEPASISSGIAARYAQAVFELVQDQGRLDKLENDIQKLTDALAESTDLAALINSPIYSRDAQSKAILAIASKMKLTKTMCNTLGLMASKRRLFVLPSLLEKLSGLIADHKSELSAEVTSAKALTKAQSEKLSKMIAARVGKAVKINATINEDIIGGLVVKVGSKMIDTSIRSKLNSLQNVMKEVG